MFAKERRRRRRRVDTEVPKRGSQREKRIWLPSKLTSTTITSFVCKERRRVVLKRGSQREKRIWVPSELT